MTGWATRRRFVTVIVAMTCALWFTRDAQAEYCWMLGCNGMRGWLKVARDAEADVKKGATALFGSPDLPKPGTVVVIKRFAFLRDQETRPRLDKLEEPRELQDTANVLAGGSKVRILRYEGPENRFVFVEVVSSDGDGSLPTHMGDAI